MIIPSEITKLISLVNNGMIWLYIGVFFIFSYLFISLLTWSFLKPLKYLGIPTIIVGVLFVIIRFTPSILLSFISTNNAQVGIIKVLLPSILRPALINGLICLGSGIVMIIIYNIINNKIKQREI